jgi:hypothetical protein
VTCIEPQPERLYSLLDDSDRESLAVTVKPGFPN